MESDSIKLQVEKILESSREEIKTKVLNTLQSEIEQKIRWCLDTEISSIVNEFFKTELKDEITNTLSNSKEVILKEVEKGIIESTGEIAKTMLAKASKSLDSSYQGDKVIKELFNIY